jgi:hypothetical protein
MDPITWFKCARKNKHRTERAAFAEYRKIKKSGRIVSDTLTVYQCSLCKLEDGGAAWHVGHKKKEAGDG